MIDLSRMDFKKENEVHFIAKQYSRLNNKLLFTYCNCTILIVVFYTLGLLFLTNSYDELRTLRLSMSVDRLSVMVNRLFGYRYLT